MPAMASNMNTPAAATYAQPKKGFFPPIQETVEITRDFVPLYGSTGKSANSQEVSKASSRHENIHTKIDRDEVCPFFQGIPIVPSPQLRERRQATRPHPILEVLIFVQINRRARVAIAIWELLGPIGWRHDLVECIAGSGGVLFGFAWPSNARLGKSVG